MKNSGLFGGCLKGVSSANSLKTAAAVLSMAMNVRFLAGLVNVGGRFRRAIEERVLGSPREVSFSTLCPIDILHSCEVFNKMRL